MNDSSISSLTETLRAPSVVRLFGREFAGLTVADGGDQHLARIYGFSFEGRYYRMSAPALFVVPGAGTEVPSGDATPSVDVLGATATWERFAVGVKMWAVDKLDQITRIDIATGWVEDLLLDAELGGDDGLTGRSEMVGRSEMIGRPRRKP